MAWVKIADRSTLWSMTNGSSPSASGDFRAYWSVYYDNVPDIANNRTKIKVESYIQTSLGANGPFSISGSSYVKIDGSSQSSVTLNHYISASGTYHKSSAEYWISHDAYGVGSFTWQGYGSLDGRSRATSSSTYSLPNIPRYATINSFTFAKASGGAGLSTLTCNWSVSNTCDAVEYSLGGGGWTSSGTSGTSGSFNVGGLTPNVQYSLKIRVKRTDSQLWTESGTLYATTYDYGKVTGADNINDTGTPYMTFTNPSGAVIDAYIEYGFVNGSATASLQRANISNTGAYLFTLTQGELDAIYAKMPNTSSQTIRYLIVTKVDGTNAYWSYLDRTFTVINANPSFTTWTYEDLGGTTTTGGARTTVTLTGSNQKIIKGYSNVKATITSANKMVANKSATAIRYQLTIGTKPSATANYSPSSTVEMTVNAVDNNVFNCYAIDSRNNSTNVIKTLTTDYINYTPISITSATATRTNDIGTQTTLAFSGNIFDGSFGSVSNSVKTATYKFKKTTDVSYTNGTSVITPTKTGSTFSFSGTIKGDAGTGGVNGFDATYSYNIQVIVTDELSTHTFNFILGSGTPNIAIHRDGIAINQAYDETLGGALQVNGNAYENGIRIANINQLYKAGETISDLNNALTDGCYTFSNGSNGPIGLVYGTVFVANAGGLTKGSTSGYCNQLFFDAQSNKMWCRKKIDNNAWGTWVRLLTAEDNRVVLFNGTASASITLSENAGNFEYLIVWFSDGSMNNSVTVKNTGVFDITHSRFGSFDGNYGLRLSTGTITVNGTNITASTIGSNYTVDLRFGNTLVVSDTKVTYTITKVIGFR